MLRQLMLLSDSLKVSLPLIFMGIPVPGFWSAGQMIAPESATNVRKS